jgi:hypothetical protein
LPESDPIEKIALELRDFCTGNQKKRRLGPLPSDLTTKQYFNQETHEMDEFTPEEVCEVSSRWSGYLFQDIGLAKNELSNEDSVCVGSKSLGRNEHLHIGAEPDHLNEDDDVREISAVSWLGASPKTTSRLKRFLTRFWRFN